jgi:hypothetical protein
MTTDVSLRRSLEKINDSISNQSPIGSEKEEESQKKCPHHFGYLANLPKNVSIPEECLLCSRVVECVVHS